MNRRNRCPRAGIYFYKSQVPSYAPPPGSRKPAPATIAKVPSPVPMLSLDRVNAWADYGDGAPYVPFSCDDMSTNIEMCPEDERSKVDETVVTKGGPICNTYLDPHAVVFMPAPCTDPFVITTMGVCLNAAVCH